MVLQKRCKTALNAIYDYLLYRISLKETTSFLEEKYELKITWKIILTSVWVVWLSVTGKHRLRQYKQALGINLEGDCDSLMEISKSRFTNMN